MSEFLFNNLRRRRSKSEMMHDLLVSANEGDKPTRLMYGTNLNQPKLKELLKIARATGLIEEVEAPPHKRHWRSKPTILRTTMKGHEYVKTVYNNYRMLKMEVKGS